MEERFLPIGIQDFEKLRRGGYVYVDKTGFVYKLARLSTPFFLRGLHSKLLKRTGLSIL